VENLVEELTQRWLSPLVSRSHVGTFSGGLLTPKYMANIDSRGEGPPRIRVGRKIAYPTGDLARWIAARVSDPQQR